LLTHEVCADTAGPHHLSGLGAGAGRVPGPYAGAASALSPRLSPAT